MTAFHRDGRRRAAGLIARVAALAIGLALDSIVAFGSGGLVEPPSPSVTFSKDIAPILYNRCGNCHRPGGSAPFSVLTYTSVRDRAKQIAEVTERREMPPVKAEPGYGDFVGQRVLTDAEIARIQRWVDEGAPEGNPRDRPPEPRWTDGWQLGQPDLIVTLPRAYTLRAGGSDIFHVFVVPIPINVVRYVRGVEFHPGNARVVHHANMLFDRTPTSRTMYAHASPSDDQGMVSRTAEYPPGQLLGWVPGQPDPLLPNELAWRLEPGTDLVIQLHMMPMDKDEAVQPSIGFFFGEGPPRRAPALLRLGPQDLDIPAGATDYTAADSFELPADVTVLAVKPHAHFLARSIQGMAVLPDGSTKWLIYIKDWDFRWQNVYRFVTPIPLPKGTVLTMRYTYDNSLNNHANPHAPPQRTHWGPRASDEMGDLWIQVLPRDDRDLPALNRAFARKMTEQDAVGDETLLASDPENLVIQDDVGLLYLQLDEPAKAIPHLEVSVRLRPGVAAAHYNLAIALTRELRTVDAIREYREALRVNPDFSAVHDNLANLLASQGRVDEAAVHYREALRLEPRNPRAHNNLGNLFMRHGRFDDAASQFRQALALDAQLPDAHYNLGLLCETRGELSEAVRHLRNALQLAPASPPIMAELSWVLATASDARLREAAEAVRLAERLAIIVGRRNPAVLDILAAAHASAGMFDLALATISEATRLVSGGPIAIGLRERESLYRRGQAYRERAGAAPALTPWHVTGSRDR